MQPFEEPDFIENSVANGGESWLDRYHAIKNKLDTTPLAAPLELGPLPEQMDAYERCNLWLLASALAYGAEKVRFVCLWDGSGGDGQGGTAHMVEEMKKKQRRGLVGYAEVVIMPALACGKFGHNNYDKGIHQLQS